MVNLNIKGTPIVIVVFIVITIFSACSKSYFFQSEVDIPDGVWSSEKVAIFEPEITDTSKHYSIILSVLNTEDYRYSNIWFFITTKSPEGAVQKDTVQYLMAEETGKWLGKKKGDNYEQLLYFKNLVHFPKKGKYTFEIQQGMRDVKLKGITKVGILFEEINQK